MLTRSSTHFISFSPTSLALLPVSSSFLPRCFDGAARGQASWRWWLPGRRWLVARGGGGAGAWIMLLGTFVLVAARAWLVGRAGELELPPLRASAASRTSSSSSTGQRCWASELELCCWLHSHSSDLELHHGPTRSA
jgi:hypothetical protein